MMRKVATAVALVAVSLASGYAGGLVAGERSRTTDVTADPVTVRDRSELTATAVRTNLSSVVVLEGRVVPPERDSRAGDQQTGDVITRTGLYVVSPVPAQQLHRLPERITSLAVRIEGGPVAACTFVSFAANLGPDGGGEPQLRCRLDPEIATFVGLPVQVAVAVAEVEDVVTLPLTAVDGDAVTGEVYLRTADGKWQRRSVGLGISDGRRVEITWGVAEGDVVADPVPTVFGGRR